MYNRQYPYYGNNNDQPYQPPPLGNQMMYPPFGSPMGNQHVPQMQQSAQHLSPQMRTISPAHSRHGSNEVNNLRGPSRSLSPGLSAANAPASFQPTDRSLPAKDVTASNITDAYVAFILYCNPNFPLDVDTSVLRTNFSSPPKSDNKDFETFRLFELIKKFDAKEIKTWGQLALDLGVEAPDVSRGQSVQKVQQYSVRLKRWMRAMHVDAFFEYLLGKNHSYFQEIPHPNDPYPAGGRDGVSAEEDLAIRALDPSFRPKRGRRRNSEAEQDDDAQSVVDNQAQIAPRSAYPASAFPSANLSFNTPSTADPWTNASAIPPPGFDPWVQKLDAPHSAIGNIPSHIRWQNPGTPHPMTALPGSMNAHIDAALQNEPKSAITPSSRKRRKHGPAVSSAWPSTNAPGAKPRGRPPASKNVQDGPFNTFPADPANEKPAPRQTTTATNTTGEPKPSDAQPPWSEQLQSAARQPELAGRPGRLSLQVPQHTGGPVRLATPPRLMVTNETSEDDTDAMDHMPSIEDPTANGQSGQVADVAIIGFDYESLKRALASDLLRAELIGRQHRLSGEEAKRLAEAVLQRFNIPRDDRVGPLDNIQRLNVASWLGIQGHINMPPGSATSHGKHLFVKRFRVGQDGYEERVSATDENQSATREVFDLSWSSSMGSCNGSFELKSLALVAAPKRPWDDVHDALLTTWIDTARRVGIDEHLIRRSKEQYADLPAGARAGDDGVNWKAKFQALEFGATMAKGEFMRYRELLIQKVLETII